MKKSLIKFTILIGAIALTGFLYGQTTRIENLKQSISSASNPEDSMGAIFAVCGQWRNLPVDTVNKWAFIGEKIATRLKNENAVWRAKYYLQTSLMKKGAYDSVLQSCMAAANWLITQPGENWSLHADYQLLKANTLIRTSRFKEAISTLYELLAEADKKSDTLIQVKSYSSLGWVQMEMEQNRQALNLFQKSLRVGNNKFLFRQYGILYSNIASTYNNLGKFDSASFYINKAIEGARETENLSNLCNALNIQADIFLNQNNAIAAKKALSEAVAIRRQIGDPFYTISDLAQLSLFYSQNSLQPQGIELANEALKLCQQYAISSKLPFVYASLAENYKTQGNFKAYSEILEKTIYLKDSLYRVNSAESLADLQAKYNVQKKENIIIQQQVQIVKRDYWIACSFAATSAGLLILFAVYRKLRQKQHLKLQTVINQQAEKSAIAVYEAEENQRHRIAAELHDNIGSQISYISSNINWIVDPPVPLTLQQQTERLENINETSQSLMRNMRETLWALNGNQILLDEFADKLKVHIQSSIKFLPGLDFHSTETPNESPFKIPPIVALNLFRICQEAVNNSIKHANASSIILHITSEANRFTIEIVDNGKGFNESLVNGEHYGLRNMRFRAKESNVAININARLGKGTSILISFPANSS